MALINQANNNRIELEDFEQQEAWKYRKGNAVELKSRPGQIYIIEEYDPMMVPPIWLVDEPKPYYPEELNLRSHPFYLLSSQTAIAA